MNKLFCGDSRDIMKNNIKEGSVDLIVTSPPYNIGVNYDNYNDKRTWDNYYEWVSSWMAQCYKVLKKGGRIAINIPNVLTTKDKKNKQLVTYLDNYITQLKNNGFTIREVISWIKAYEEFQDDVFCGGNTAWGSWNSPSCPYCRSFSEFIIVAHKEDKRLQHKGESDITKDEFLRYTRNVWFFPSERKRTHPAPFPEELPKRLIKLYTYKNDVVMDLFNGWGTTTKVAKDLGRQYIGIDLSLKYVELAKERLV